MSIRDREDLDKLLRDGRTNVELAAELGTSEATIRRIRRERNIDAAAETPEVILGLRHRAVTTEDARQWIIAGGDNPDDYDLHVRSIAYGEGQWSNRVSATPKKHAGSGPEWPVIQQAQQVTIHVPAIPSLPARDLALALKGADPQIGFRAYPGGELDPFHDPKALALFVEVARRNQPDKIQILGDFLDLAGQGRFAQEAAFAQTTQAALDEGHRFLAKLRAACPNADIIVIEGNHDKRMQNFIETNALAAFGLKRADMPDAWPVMSIPYLLRLDDLNIRYVDAYPAATDWDNDTTRNIHGTKANSRGSTTSQYVHELPHLNTWAGHTHRVEITYRTVTGARGIPVESYSANPGALCRTDGAVPSVNGAIGADGRAVKVAEDWQQGFGLCYFNDTESWPFVYRIRDGVTILDGEVISA